jgi:16S rRNA (uracil1498-N3)-methyltransferase
MKALFLEGYDGGEYHLLSEKDSRYLCTVRRLRPGDSIQGRDAAGNLYHCTLEAGASARRRLRVQRKGGPVGTGPEISLIQCLPKARKLDLIIRQTTEAGIAAVIPAFSRFSIPRFDAAGAKTERWRAVARQAAQQSGAERIPEIAEPRPLAEAVDAWLVASGEDGLGLFFHQTPLDNASLHGYLCRDWGRIAVVIGPEGGLSDDEVELLAGKGFKSAYLGPSVLRTETAALYALAALQTIFREKHAWKA